MGALYTERKSVVREDSAVKNKWQRGPCSKARGSGVLRCCSAEGRAMVATRAEALKSMDGGVWVTH